MKRNANYCSENKSRWNNYNTYRLVLFAWMMNDVAVSAAPVDMSHSGFYLHWALYAVATIFVGIPLVYSEICIAQYTNCDVVSTWNFCPILRSVGFGTIYLIILKIVYMYVLTSWYLQYTFVAGFDPPPWFSCEGYNDAKCMVKRVNVSIFQHCIESQNLFNQDCGMKTASNCYFEREIGDYNTKHTNCNRLWRTLLTGFILSSIIFLISTKKDKLVKVIVRILLVYICIVLLILFCVALSTSGTWSVTTIGINWDDFNIYHCFYIPIQSFLACGVGSGVIGFLSRDISFRSPATMTAVVVPLFSNFITIIFALILLSGIKTVTYYHGGELNVLEMDDNVYFNTFASVAEILSYFDDMPLWGFIWFSTGFFCLLVNTSIMCLFLLEFLTMNIKSAHNHRSLCSLVTLSLFCLLSCPFHCSDLTVVLADVTEIIQLTSSFFFSLGIYWIYGFQKHNVDIIFMIGVKANYFWKFAWVTNPIWTFIFIYMRCSQLSVKTYENSYFVKSISMSLDEFLVYLFITLYIFIVIIGVFVHVKTFYVYDKVWDVFLPFPNWGPQDKTLFRSRNMFVPEIMTREFLYRQVRIHGYSRRSKLVNKKFTINVEDDKEMTPEKAEWSALTSN